MKIAVRIIPDGDEIQYVRYELDWLLKLLRTSQKGYNHSAELDSGRIMVYTVSTILIWRYTAMLKTPELSMPRTNKVTTVCNGNREVWTDYEEAKAYFLELMMTTEGEEHERAECVYIQLLHGLDECSDEDE